MVVLLFTGYNQERCYYVGTFESKDVAYHYVKTGVIEENDKELVSVPEYYGGDEDDFIVIEDIDKEVNKPQHLCLWC